MIGLTRKPSHCPYLSAHSDTKLSTIFLITFTLPEAVSVALTDLPDSISDVELTLQIRLPDSWNVDAITLEIGDSLFQAEVLSDKQGGYVLFNSTPGKGTEARVSQGLLASAGVKEKIQSPGTLKLLAFPNPIYSETLLSIEGEVNSQMQLMLLDIHGRLVRDFAMQGRFSISLGGENLTPGLYIVLLLEGGIPVASLRLMAQ